jgi:hypothetical protein
LQQGRDWLLDRIDAVERAAAAARLALGAATDVLAPARARRLAGEPLVPIAQSLLTTGAGPRRNAEHTLREYERAVAALRSAVVCALIRDEGLTLTQLAKAMGISRQAVARMYRTGRVAAEREGWQGSFGGG